MGARGPGSAALLFAGILASASVSAKDTLRVLAWPGYADPDLVQVFERRHDVDVEVTYVTSDDDLWDKANANGASDFDLFAVNTAELQRYIDAGISVPIRLAHVPNHARQLPRFQDLESISGLMRNGDVYAIPYTYSEMGLIYNRKLVHPPPTSMSAMWDPAYRRQVLAFDTSNHNFSIAALAFGLAPPFRIDDRAFKDVVRKLIELRRNVLAFYSTPEEVVDIFRGNDVALIFGNYGRQQLKQLRAAGADIGYVIPDEGALAWLDCWSVTRGARDRELAESWIDYTLEDPVSLALTERQGLANTINRSDATSDDDKIIWLQPLENYTMRQELWQRIRAGDPPDAFR